jgi:Ricin-type beta-trefoil lectin domain-like
MRHKSTLDQGQKSTPRLQVAVGYLVTSASRSLTSTRLPGLAVRGRSPLVIISATIPLDVPDRQPMVRYKVELHLPILVLGAEDIRVRFRRRRKAAGPYLIISRACGLALDTGRKVEPGGHVTVWPPHAEPQQLWYLRPTGVSGEIALFSAANGLALGSVSSTSGDHRPVMSEPANEPWQRWRLEDAADGAGYLLQLVHDRRFLTMNEDGQRRWKPWLESRHARRSQQWLLVLPHGNSPA